MTFPFASRPAMCHPESLTLDPNPLHVMSHQLQPWARAGGGVEKATAAAAPNISVNAFMALSPSKNPRLAMQDRCR
jgi:hypothetical protein